MERIVCPSCHTEVDNGATICPKCGAVLPKSAGGGVTLSNSYFKPGETPNQVNQQHVAQAILNENKKKENPKTALAVGIIFVAVVIILLIVLFIGSSKGSSDTDSGANTATSTVESQSVNESSAPESSDSAVVSSEDISASSVEESSEPSIEESSNTVDTKTITVEKPDDWGDIYCYIYYTEDGEDTINNGAFPGEELVETDGVYKYQIPDNFIDKECFVVFSTTKRANGSQLSTQYPYVNKGGFAISEKSSFTISDFESYAEENK